jgi:CheY-like chemotaxis protein
MPKKILLVDDDPLSLKNISLFLGEEGYRVQEAHDGVEALNCFKNDSFDLILSDIFMPRCNGFGLLEEIKKMSPHTPVIFITAYPTSDPRTMASSLGVEALILKPLLFEDLREKIERVLRKEELAKRTINSH